MKLFITVVLITMQSSFAMSVPVYSNDAESLKDYISQADFDNFYSTLSRLEEHSEHSLPRFLAISHRYQNLQDSELPIVKFYVRSPEITPAILGYTAVYVEGSHAGNLNGVGLFAYIPNAAHVCAPSIELAASQDLFARALRVYETATKHPGITAISIGMPIVIGLFYKHYFDVARTNHPQTVSVAASKCGICLDAISHPNPELLTNCIHAAEFCGACLIAALNENNICPICRANGNLS